MITEMRHGFCAMERAIVIGCPGAGKSTFARALRDATGLPLFYLDLLWHRPDRTTVSREEFDAELAAILREDRWIVDGNYLRTLRPRLLRCDTVFFLDYPLPVCLAGARARIGTAREDLPWIETELDPEFREWIEEFPRQQRPQILEMLDECREGKTVVAFHSRDEADRFLRQLKAARQ